MTPTMFGRRAARGDRRRAGCRPGETAPGAEASDVEGLVSPVDRRAFLGAGAVAGIGMSAPKAGAQGRRVGQADVARAGRRLVALRRLDDFSGGVSVHPKVVEEIHNVTSLAKEGSYGDAVARSLLSALAELYQFASWTAFDAGRLPQAGKLAQAATSTANQAGNQTLAATALSELSYITASSANPERVSPGRLRGVSRQARSSPTTTRPGCARPEPAAGRRQAGGTV